MAEQRSVCRICIGTCGTILSVENGRIARVRGDKSHPLSRGYACTKGLAAGEALSAPDRIHHAMKRQPDGSYARIDLRTALVEIAAKAAELQQEEGPETVALFKGTQAYLNVALSPMLQAWAAAVGTHNFFTTMTIDQSAKYVSWERLGNWGAGKHHFHESDVMMLVGTNPLVSLSVMGMFSYNMTKLVREARARGLKFIVIDPRRTEMAEQADLHLQVRPGQDPTLFAGIVREVLQNEWHDREFCDRHVEGMESLRRAVASFTLDHVAARVDVPAEQIRAAARMFAHEGRRGAAITGTGPNMAARSNLAQHMIDALNVICGRFRRAGDPIANPGILNPQTDVHAEVIPPRRDWQNGPKSRVRGIGGMYGEMMSATLPEEILTPGKGRIRALFVAGGNPAVAMPDQDKSVEALKALDLLVVIDPFMTPTARLAHYILPPKLMYEREEFLMGAGYEPLFMPVPFQQFVEAAVPPPAGSEATDEWWIFWELARLMGKQIVLNDVALDMDRAPTTRDILRIVAKNAAITVDALAAEREPRIFDLPGNVVKPARSSNDARFQVMPDDVEAELGELLQESRPDAEWRSRLFPFMLISRRMREVMNTTGINLPSIRRLHRSNPAYMHPDTIASIGAEPGAMVRIRSEHSMIYGRLAADPTLRRDVLSMVHCWGGLPEEEASYDEVGSCTAKLISLDAPSEPINAMPRMSAIPISVELA